MDGAIVSKSAGKAIQSDNKPFDRLAAAKKSVDLINIPRR